MIKNNNKIKNKKNLRIRTSSKNETRSDDQYVNDSERKTVRCNILVNQNYVTNINRTTLYFPVQQRVTLRYNGQITMTGSAAVVQTFRGNSCYDPDLSGAGSQPLYWDILSQVYAKYCVLSARIAITCTNANAVPSTISVFPSRINSFGGAIYDRCTQPRASYGVLGANTGGNSQLYLATFDSTARISGLKDAVDDEDFKALTNANPTRGWFFLLGAQSFDGSAVTIYMNVTIDYDVILTDRLPLFDV
jgi:hypothetical protein